ncbi:HdeD family acid-resistance protein [Ulvibacterium sp.]|uniref:HdeD family acid-resistance protein n=1 Tax=Ulvibacterium sp. TaxID=2665914 RepID=UPI002602C2BE|nr:DUF308 domain-containing protein [Ulvibacterium sp.]
MNAELLTSTEKAVKQWYIPFMVGVLFLALGVYTMVMPLESYLALIVLFSISFLISGIFEVVFAVSNRDQIRNWGWSLVFGILSVGIGALLIVRPDISALTLPIYVGFLVFFRSLGAIGISIDLKSIGILDWGNLMVFGVLGLIFSFLLLWNPLFAGFTIVVWTALALMTIGIFWIYFSTKLKKLKKTT